MNNKKSDSFIKISTLSWCRFDFTDPARRRRLWHVLGFGVRAHFRVCERGGAVGGFRVEEQWAGWSGSGTVCTDTLVTDNQGPGKAFSRSQRTVFFCCTSYRSSLGCSKLCDTGTWYRPVGLPQWLTVPSASPLFNAPPRPLRLVRWPRLVAFIAKLGDARVSVAVGHCSASPKFECVSSSTGEITLDKSECASSGFLVLSAW